MGFRNLFNENYRSKFPKYRERYGHASIGDIFNSKQSWEKNSFHDLTVQATIPLKAAREKKSQLVFKVITITVDPCVKTLKAKNRTKHTLQSIEQNISCPDSTQTTKQGYYMKWRYHFKINRETKLSNVSTNKNFMIIRLMLQKIFKGILLTEEEER